MKHRAANHKPYTALRISRILTVAILAIFTVLAVSCANFASRVSAEDAYLTRRTVVPYRRDTVIHHRHIPTETEVCAETASDDSIYTPLPETTKIEEAATIPNRSNPKPPRRSQTNGGARLYCRTAPPSQKRLTYQLQPRRPQIRHPQPIPPQVHRRQPKPPQIRRRQPILPQVHRPQPKLPPRSHRAARSHT